MPEIHESEEDYLKTIYRLSKTNPYLRNIDIAAERNVSKPSITAALRKLKTAGYLIIDDSNHIHLTKNGCKKAEEITEKHTLLTQLLQNTLGVNPITAEKDACRIEHIISEETYIRLKLFLTEQRKETHHVN